MPSAKTVWGIDVGQCALKALRLQWRDGKLRALGFDVIEHAKILSQPDADEQALIRSALGKFTSRNSLKGSTIVISVPGQASFTRFIKLPPVETKKIPEIVRYEARQQIPFNLEDVVWDYQTIAKPATAGPREVEVGIFAMKKDIVNDYVSDFLAMRIEPDVVQMAPVALYNYLRYDKKEGAGATLLMDVGAENTNLVIADGERVWIRNVPIGGNNFTNALAREFKLPFSKAENLKRHAAESKHSRQVFQAMHPIYGDLLTEVQRSIGYYTSLHRDSRVERVVGLGNSFRLPGLGKYISQNLGVDVQVVDKIASLAEAEALSAPLFKDPRPGHRDNPDEPPAARDPQREGLPPQTPVLRGGRRDPPRRGRLLCVRPGHDQPGTHGYAGPDRGASEAGHRHPRRQQEAAGGV
jgi:type IV pilus assembly protein PilM